MHASQRRLALRRGCGPGTTRWLVLLVSYGLALPGLGAAQVRTEPSAGPGGGVLPSGYGWPGEVWMLGALSLFLIAGTVAWLSFRRPAGGTASRSREDRETRELRWEPVAPAPVPLAPPAPSPLETEVGELHASVERLELAMQKMDYGQRGMVSELDARLQRFLDVLSREQAVMQEDNERSKREWQQKSHGEIVELRELVGSLQLELMALQEHGRTGLINLLRELPVSVLDRPMRTQNAEGPILAARVEQALSHYFAGAAANRELAVAFRARVEGLREALSRFQEAAQHAGAPEAETKLRLLFEDLAQMQDELSGLAGSDSQQRLRLLFAVDITPHEGARQGLADSLASGLQREIVKLENIEEYYEKRLLLAATRAAAECADLADTRLHAAAGRAEVQRAVAAIFAAGGLTEMAPTRNQPFVALEHSILQMTRCGSSSDRRGTVAQLVARGIRFQDRVLRKATVVVFD